MAGRITRDRRCGGGPLPGLVLTGADMNASFPTQGRQFDLEFAARTAPRKFSLMLAGLSAATGILLAAHHPLSAGLAIAAWLLAAGLAARYWTQTPLLLALLPLIGFAPWSGWITFEELDLLVLACAAGGYASIGLGRVAPPRAPVWRQMLGYSPLTLILLALFGASVLLSMWRGFEAAGGFEFGWFQGYHEPMNSLRVGKSYFMALLLLPLWVQAGVAQPRQLQKALLLGMTGALATTGLAALSERLAYTALLDFSTQYRSTALFWEMHVGGAALDCCLAMAMPFAVDFWLRQRSPWRFAAAAALVLLGCYAVLTTFSRGVYAALPVSLAILLMLQALQRRRAGAARRSRAALLGALLITASFGSAAALMFGGSGYRGLLALLGVLAILLTMPASHWLPTLAQRMKALFFGTLLAAPLATIGWAASQVVPKAAYGVYALVWLGAAALHWQAKPGQVRPFYSLLVATNWFLLLACPVFVADYWGGAPAGTDAAWVMAGLGLLLPLFWGVPALWPFRASGLRDCWRERGKLFTTLLLLSSLLAAIGGGAYLRDRVSTWHEDLQSRFQHWQKGLAMLETPQQILLGKGLGRYPASNFLAELGTVNTGDYRVRSDAGRPYLALTGGRHQISSGELLRVSQRIDAPKGQVLLTVLVRTRSEVALHAEICEKQLLYEAACMAKSVNVKPQGGAWQQVALPLGEAPEMGGKWYAPRFIVFSVGIGSNGGLADVGAMNLIDASGRSLLSNGDFAGQMAHWFFSSDRYHLPWHLKNAGLHVFFEQGAIGLALLAALLSLALWRLIGGRGRNHALAPALAASMAGFFVVGLFDSLLDAPRIAFMFYGLLAISLGLRGLPLSAEAAGLRPPGGLSS